MGDLKFAIKESKQLLTGGKNQEAIDLLQPFLDRDIEDYLLFSLAALANANLEEYEEAQELYEKGIKLDPSKPQAWLGLFKLYDAEDIELEKRGFDVCEKISEIGDDNKKAAARGLKRRILLKFSQYEDLSTDLGDDPDFMVDIIDKIETKKVPSTIERQIIGEAFQRLIPHFSEYPEYNLKYCKFLYDNGKSYRQQIIEYSSSNVDRCEWLCDRFVEFLAEDYFVSLDIKDSTIWGLLDENPISEVLNSSLLLLKELREEKLTAALEILDQLTYAQTIFYPTCLIACRLFVEIENWEQLVKVLNAFPKRLFVPPEISTIRNWLIVKGNLEIDGTVPDNLLIDSCCTDENVPKEFIRERIILGLSVAKKSCTWKDKLDDYDQSRVRFLEAFHSKDYSTAIQESSKILDSPKVSWMDLLEVAEARYATGMDCVPLLIKAAKLAPRSSRIFYMLGKALQKKNPTKARGCLERAVKVRPLNANYVQALDEILADADEKPEVRLSYLKPLAVKAKARWIRETIGKLSLATGDFDTAAAEFQKLIRESPKDVGVWAKLAEVYSRKGHLNSAVNAYKEILELQPKSNHYISLVELLIRLRNDEDALEKCAEWREIGLGDTDSVMLMDLLETLAHMRLVITTFGEDKMSHLRRSIKLITPVIATQPIFALPYKLAGDILLHLSRYHDKFLKSFDLDPSWEVTSEGILKKALNYYMKALQLCKDNILAWSDLAICLLLSSQQYSDIEAAANAMEILKKAIISTDFDATKSTLWTLMGEGKRLSKQPPASQQHCYVRALQLNKANDEAWLRLAILYMENGQMNEASEAFETALKYNPHSAEAWCGWAMHATATGSKSEASAMYRQSLILKSLPIAVTRFTAVVCEDMKQNQTSFDTSSVLTDFPEIFDIYYSSQTKSNTALLTHLGVMAELFGHYSEAILCHKDAGANDSDPNLQRALLKEGQFLETGSKLNPKWVELTKQPVEKLLTAVKENHIYRDLFQFLQEDDENSSKLHDLFMRNTKKISIPLVISAIILFDIKISDSAVQVLHDVLPRHELVDVFPTILPEGLDSELQYLEQDGEAPFRYRHEIAKLLYQELLKKREAVENSPV